jgi:hypothetical protein
MLVSSTSMNAASETATAMIQGLALGCQISSAVPAAVAALIAPSLLQERCITKAKARRANMLRKLLI